MKALKMACFVTVVLLAGPQVRAQNPNSKPVTEADKKVVRNFLAGQRAKVLQTTAIMNLRQIGLALFEFETEYGSFPDEKTAVLVKEATGTKAELKAKTANDCFYQLIAAQILLTDSFFSLDSPKQGEEKPEVPALIKKCAFSYLAGQNAAGNPSRPVIVAPLVNGKKTFDPAVLGGKAVILRVDNSVQSFPIDKDGHVMIDGMDLFDPAQSFWDGKVPPIAWPAE